MCCGCEQHQVSLLEVGGLRRRPLVALLSAWLIRGADAVSYTAESSFRRMVWSQVLLAQSCDRPICLVLQPAVVNLSSMPAAGVAAQTGPLQFLLMWYGFVLCPVHMLLCLYRHVCPSSRVLHQAF
jgi:hypothetical protein